MQSKCKEVDDLQMKHKHREFHIKVQEEAGVWTPKHLSIVTNANNLIELEAKKASINMETILESYVW